MAFNHEGFVNFLRDKGASDRQILGYVQKKLPDFAENVRSFIKNNPLIQGGADWNAFSKVAAQIAKEENFPLSVLMAQAALESGRGQSGLTQRGNNYFGIKGRGSAGSLNMPTQEADQNGTYYWTNSDFAAYRSPADSVRAYINLIKNNYPQAYQARYNPYLMVQAIKAGGYATSPTYVQSVTNTPEFKQYLGT